MSRLWTRLGSALIGVAAEMDDPAISQVAELMFREVVRQRAAFSLEHFTAQHGVRPAFLRAASSRVYDRFLAIAWQDHAVTEREEADLRLIASRLQLSPGTVAELQADALDREMRRREGISTPRRETLASVGADLARGIGRGFGSILTAVSEGVERASANRASRARIARPATEAPTRRPLNTRKLEGLTLPIAMPPMVGGVRRLSVAPPKWNPPADEIALQDVQLTAVRLAMSPLQRWLAMSLGIKLDQVDATTISGQIDAKIASEPKDRRVGVLRRQCRAAGADDDSNSIYELWSNLKDRLWEVELADAGDVAGIQALGLVPSVVRAYSQREASDLYYKNVERKFRCRGCRQWHERDWFSCIDCGDLASNHPRVVKLGEADPHLGAAWWEA